MNAFWEGVVTIVLAVVGLAVVSVIVSRRANTTGVVQSFFSGVSNSIGTASAPVTGTSVPLDLSYPGSSGLDGFIM